MNFAHFVSSKVSGLDISITRSLSVDLAASVVETGFITATSFGLLLRQGIFCLDPSRRACSRAMNFPNRDLTKHINQQ
jgi:hypothetical protein